MDDDLTSVPGRPPAPTPPAETAGESTATVLSGGETTSLPPTSINELGSLLVGKRLGDYQLDEFVGGGGMGAVFKALDTTLNRTVAVKVLAGHQATDEEMLRRFRNEAQSAARLNHENIGLVHAVGSNDGWHYIVFEYIKGTNLRDVVRQRGPLSVAAVVDISLQIAAALEHAARRNVTHRDIKPSNIIITPAGRAKLVDMGLARLQHVGGEQDLTVSGMTLGTFDYISPEQARDARAADIRSDLYSLGCTMFFMLVGRAPFAEGTMVQKLLQHQQEPPPAIEALRTDVPRRLAAVIRRLMAKHPEDRFERPAALEAELFAIAEDEGIDLSVARSAIEVAPVVKRRQAGIIWPWAIAVGCLGALVAWLALQQTGQLPVPAAGERVDPVPTVPVSEAGGDKLKRVVLNPVEPEEYGDLATAVAAAADGDVIELAADREHAIGPLELLNKSLTVRAAARQRPMLRVDELQFPLTEADQAVWSVGGGQLVLEGIDIRMTSENEPSAGSRSVFWLSNRGQLTCRNVGIVVSANTASEELGDGPVDRIITVSATEPAARTNDLSTELASVASGQPAPTSAVSAVEMTNVFINGDATCCVLAGGSEAVLAWRNGGVTTSGRFVEMSGNAAGELTGPRLTLDLNDATFACQLGFAWLADTPTQIRVPRLAVSARQCRFLIPEPAALLEQAGVAEPEVYQAAIDWQDWRGRYEGSRFYRRIDGAGDPIEIDYSSAGRSLVHQDFLDTWPSPSPRGP
jgi:hypothetical protein